MCIRSLLPRAGRLLLAASLVVSAGCDGPVRAPARVTSHLAFDLSSILAPGGNFQTVTILAQASLTTTPAGSAPTTQTLPVGPEAALPSFSVTVPLGSVTFQGSVLSNNGTPLYQGQRSVEITSDGFQEVVPLTPMAPVMVVQPDELSVRLGAPAAFAVENRGQGTLEYAIESITGPGICDGPCIQLDAETFSVSEEESQPLFVTANTTQEQSYAVRLASAQGTVEVRVNVEPLGTIIGSVTVEGVGSSGVPVTLSGASSASTSTSSSGFYFFTALPLGDYTVAFTPPFGSSFTETAVAVSLSRSAPETTVDFAGEWIRTAAITGTAAAEGSPIVGATVTLSGTESRSTVTDANGQYAFTSLRAGTYTLRFFRGQSVTTRSVTLEVGQTVVENFFFVG